MKKLNVDLGDRSYPIYIGQNIIDQSEYFQSYIKGKQVLIVTNETVAPLYLEQLKAALTDFQVDEVILPDGEKYKTLDTVNLIFDALLSKKHNRTTTLIALGGGVVGDMTGFAAASYQRGVDFIQVPTTVLSQVDSSVGGKTGVNHVLGKNMIGAFKQPNAVVIDINVLNTLPERELSAGLAEVIKYGLIGDKEFYHWMLNNTAGLMAKDAQLLSEAIYRSCHNKAVVVAQDEKESGIRATLNLGHTYGHAIETDQGYGHWLHGEAVSVGILMAADLSNRLGWISLDEIAELKKFLVDCKLPIVAPESMTNNDFTDRMLVDKKVLDGRIRLVLLKEIGEAVVTSDFDIDIFNQGLNSFTA